MDSLVSPERLKTATEPIALCGDDYEVVKFMYEAIEERSPTIDIVLRHRRTLAKAHYRFSGVKLEYLPPVLSPAAITVMNARARGWETPRDIQIAVGEDHPDAGLLFYAGDIQRIA